LFTPTRLRFFIVQVAEEASAVAALEERIQALESGMKFEATTEAVQAVEREFLIKFREIREALQRDGSSTTANSKEMEALRAENELLKKKNEKLEYRVAHLVESMEQIYKFDASKFKN
jgi:uncharacterized coiled-coil DUF342 family protein